MDPRLREDDSILYGHSSAPPLVIPALPCSSFLRRQESISLDLTEMDPRLRGDDSILYGHSCAPPVIPAKAGIHLDLKTRARKATHRV